MIYGTHTPHILRDSTDLIGIRTLLLRQYWQASGGSDDPMSQKPAAPGVPGGVLLMGEQTVKGKGVYETTWTYQGINGDGKSVTFKDRDSSIDYGFDPGFAQVPIHVHKDFLAMLEAFQGYPGNDGQAVIWPAQLSKKKKGGALSLGAKSGGALNPMYGVQACFEMEGTYRFRYAARALPKSLQEGVGLIADKLPGSPPALRDGRNWLKAPSAFERKGVVYDITETYWLSRRGGWPEPVYRKGYFK